MLNFSLYSILEYMSATTGHVTGNVLDNKFTATAHEISKKEVDVKNLLDKIEAEIERECYAEPGRY